MIDQKWNSKRPFVFAHVVLTRVLGARKARYIRERIDHQLELWDRGIHSGLVGDALAEDRSREGRINRRVKEEKDCLARSFNSTLLWGKLHQAVRQAANLEWGGSSSGGCLH